MNNPSIMLVHSDAAGHPVTYPTPFGHFIVRSDAAMPAVDQMNSGFPIPQDACAEADILCICKWLGMNPLPSPGYIAGLAHEGYSGTSTVNLVSALQALGVPCHPVAGIPPSGFIMNSAMRGGGILPPSEFGIYAVASQGWYCQIDANPTPQPTTQEDDMRVRGPFFWAARNQPHWFHLDAAGKLWHKWWDAKTGIGNEQIPGVYDPTAGLDYSYFWNSVQLTVEAIDGFVWAIWQADTDTKWNFTRLP